MGKKSLFEILNISPQHIEWNLNAIFITKTNADKFNKSQFIYCHLHNICNCFRYLLQQFSLLISMFVVNWIRKF